MQTSTSFSRRQLAMRRHRKGSTASIERLAAHPLLKSTEIASQLGVSVGFLADLRRRGQGPVWRRLSSRAIRYSPADVGHWLDGCAVNGRIRSMQ